MISDYRRAWKAEQGVIMLNISSDEQNKINYKAWALKKPEDARENSHGSIA